MTETGEETVLSKIVNENGVLIREEEEDKSSSAISFLF
jgi:hypothetical protein